MSEHSRRHNVIVQIKVKLLGVSKPPVWRQLQLRADTNLDHLHEMLVAAFGWQDYHMHCFQAAQRSLECPIPSSASSTSAT
jgi:Plasmid pRiA4b ORF-3-like protein